MLQIRVNKERGKTTLVVAGELDYSNIAQLQEEIERQEAPRVEVNLKDLQFMDSSGAGMLLHQARLLRSQNRILEITHIPANISHDLEIIGFFRVLETLQGAPQRGGG
ncbi:MAG: STAS domain-containing protein [Thermoanaerobacteraceae bacterium]|nr:STAS domain-containing protein [Thermoanaerobacteraceae bacterium]